MNRRRLIAAAASWFVVSCGSAAFACDYTLDPWPVQSWPDNEFVDDLPSNTFFVENRAPEWESGGDRLESELDEELGAILFIGQSWAEGQVWRTDGMIEGAAYGADGCSSQAHDCGFVAGAPDTTAPAPAEVTDVSVRWVKNGRDGGAAGCPDLDTMSIRIAASDDRTPSRQLVILSYIGTDSDEASTKGEPDYVFAPRRSWEAGEEMNPATIVGEVILGTSKEHDRSGPHFRGPGPYCFSIALMDRSGNVGERSAPVCLDTADRHDPYVDPVREDHVQCTTSPSRAADSAVALLLLAAVALLRRRAAMARRPSEI